MKRIIWTLEWLDYQYPNVVNENLKDSLKQANLIWVAIESALNVSLKKCDTFEKKVYLIYKYVHLIFKADRNDLYLAVYLGKRLKKLLPTFYIQEDKTQDQDHTKNLANKIDEDIKNFIRLAYKIFDPIAENNYTNGLKVDIENIKKKLEEKSRKKKPEGA